MNVKPSQAGKIVEMRLSGMSAAEVAVALGVSPNYVYMCSRGKGIPTQPRGRRAAVEEPVVTAKARVQAEVAAGKRCRVCWLLLPCADHQP